VRTPTVVDSSDDATQASRISPKSFVTSRTRVSSETPEKENAMLMSMPEARRVDSGQVVFLPLSGSFLTSADGHSPFRAEQLSNWKHQSCMTTFRKRTHREFLITSRKGAVAQILKSLASLSPNGNVSLHEEFLQRYNYSRVRLLKRLQPPIVLHRISLGFNASSAPWRAPVPRPFWID
jgi:hypothetical protein